MMIKKEKLITPKLVLYSIFFILISASALAFPYGNGTYGSSTFGNDTIAPIINSFTCSQREITQGGVLTCSCSATDETNITPTVTRTLNPSTSSAGSFTTTCTATDTGGNTVTESYTYVVLAPPVTTGGAGGSSTQSYEGQSATGVWDTLATGQIATLQAKDGQLGITQVDFSTGEKLLGVKMEIKGIIAPPPEVKTFDKKVYKYFQIDLKTPKTVISAVKEATVSFKVSKLWLTENKFETKNIALYRYEEAWNELETSFEKEDSTFAYYQAKTIKFSYFAIGESKKEITVSPPVAEKKEEAPEEKVEAPLITTIVEEKPVAAPKKKLPSLWSVWGLLIDFLILLIVYRLKNLSKKRKTK